MRLQRRYGAAWVLGWGGLCTLLLGIAGCGSSEPEPTPFARFERLPSVEQLSTVALGVYHVPVPLSTHQRDDVDTRALHGQVQLEFELHAAVLPKYEKSLTDSYERNEGRISNSVIQVCRNAPIEDLLDPSLTTLKSHLMDALQPFFRHVPLERLHLSDSQVKQL